MRQIGYMVTREQMDEWCEKRPAYAANAIDAKRCLNKASMVDNYFVSCSTLGSKMPTFEELAKVRISKVRVKNNGTNSRNIRVGYKVYGSSDAIAWTAYQSVGAGSEGLFYIEGLSVDTSYAVYFQESTSSQNLYAFSNNTFVSAISLGYGFIQQTLFPSSTIGQVGKDLKLYVTSMKISMRIQWAGGGVVDMWTTGLQQAGHTDQSAYDTDDHTFLDIPFNTVFSLHVSGSRLETGTYYTLDLISGSGTLDAIYQDEVECEYEFNTGATMTTDYYEINAYPI